MTYLEFAAGDVVSSGTLRTADLVPAFYGALVQANCAQGIVRFVSLSLAARVWLKADRDGAFDAEEHDGIGMDLVSQLMDALSELAPAGCYFGAHEGDGACFGFWVNYEDSEIRSINSPYF